MDFENRKTMIFGLYFTDIQLFTIYELLLCNHFYTSSV
jgi:hypothetical protein